MAIEHSAEKQTDSMSGVSPQFVRLTKIGLDAASIQYCHEIVEMIYLLECCFSLAHG